MTVPKPPFDSTISPFGTVIFRTWHKKTAAADGDKPISRTMLSCFIFFSMHIPLVGGKPIEILVIAAKTRRLRKSTASSVRFAARLCRKRSVSSETQFRDSNQKTKGEIKTLPLLQAWAVRESRPFSSRRLKPPYSQSASLLQVLFL